MKKIFKFLDDTFLDLGRQFKWTYLPPLMVYLAAGISGSIKLKNDIMSLFFIDKMPKCLILMHGIYFDYFIM